MLKNFFTKERFKYIFLTLFILIVFSGVFNFIKLNFIIGLDCQNVRSLPHKVYIIKKSDFIAFYSDNRMTEYFPAGSIFIKKVVARQGDIVNTNGRKFYVNGKFIGEAMQYDLKGNPVEFVKFNNYRLKAGEYFVIGTNKFSYDSRYWGLVYENQIIGPAFPLF